MNKRFIKIRIKILIGFTLSKIMPGRTQKIKESFALQYWGRGVGNGRIGRKVETLIRFYLAYSDKSTGKQLEQSYKHFWQNEIDAKWYVNSQKRFNEETLPALAPHVEVLKSLLKKSNIDTICEIGTGDGMLLSHLKSSLDETYEYIGLDLSKERMEHNLAHFSGIKFIACDAFDWITKSSTNNTLYVTNGGVMEYFSQISLTKLLVKVRSEQPDSLFALFHEPIAPEHNLASEHESQLTEGGEFSYSHNYPNLFQLTGFTAHHQVEEAHPAGYRALTIIAVNDERKVVPHTPNTKVVKI